MQGYQANLGSFSQALSLSTWTCYCEALISVLKYFFHSSSTELLSTFVRVTEEV